jgi:hypothetical protein
MSEKTYKWFCIKWDSLSMPHLGCAGCEGVVQSEPGPAIFLDHTAKLVCDACAEKEDPKLFKALQILRQAGEHI